MRYTNKLNLPESFMNYASNRKPVENRYSVTELLKPIREIKLTRLHYDDIEVDVSEMIPAIFGSAVHKILEENTTENAEESFTAELGGITISGRLDLIDYDNLTIKDYKTCSVSKKDFEDWRMQGLIYAYLVFRSKDIIIRHLKFYAIYKDYSKIRNSDLRPVFVYEYEIQDSDYIFIESWLKERIAALKSSEIPECSDEDKWYSGTKYAVYKKEGDKRAMAVCDTEEAAHTIVAEKTGVIEVRYGENVKCNNYCKCRKYCYKEEEC